LAERIEREEADLPRQEVGQPGAGLGAPEAKGAVHGPGGQRAVWREGEHEGPYRKKDIRLPVYRKVGTCTFGGLGGRE
jgi:hypothetical protein